MPPRADARRFQFSPGLDSEGVHAVVLLPAAKTTPAVRARCEACRHDGAGAVRFGRARLRRRRGARTRRLLGSTRLGRMDGALGGRAHRFVLRDVVNALDRPADSEPITSAAAYYGLARTVNRSVYEHAVAASTTGAVDEGVALGDAPADTVQRLVGQVLTTLEGRGDADLVTSAGGGMRLDVYLQTRTFELAIHTVDIAIAVRIDPEIPGDVLDEVCALAARLAVLNGDGVTVLRALTGRTDLRGFSVV